MKNLLIFTSLIVTTQLFSQSQPVPCGAITERVPIPLKYSMNARLPPDPCDALASYNTERVISVCTTPNYLEIKKQIRVVVETLIDPDNCNSVARELSRDTIEVGRKLIYAASTTPTGGYWTVRMELVVYAPVSRPVGFYATKLPNGSMSQEYKDGSTIDLKEYWVVHVGEYKTITEAKKATNELKKTHPEFCRAYPYFLPNGCEHQYKYVTVSF
jgi:hypothetical protein